MSTMIDFFTDFQAGRLSPAEALERARAISRDDLLEYFAAAGSPLHLDASDLADRFLAYLAEEAEFDALVNPPQPWEAMPISDDQDMLFTDSLHMFFWRIVVSGKSDAKRWWSKSDDWLLKLFYRARLFVPIEVLDAAGTTRTIKVFAFTADERLRVNHNARAFFSGSPSDGTGGILHGPAPGRDTTESESPLDAERFEAVTIFPNLQLGELPTYRLLEPFAILSPKTDPTNETAVAVALDAFIDEAARIALEKAKTGAAAAVAGATGTGAVGTAFVEFLLEQVLSRFTDKEQQLVVGMPTMRLGERKTNMLPIDSLARPGAETARRGTGPELWFWGNRQEPEILVESMTNASAFGRKARPGKVTIDLDYYVEARALIRRSSSRAQ